MHKILSSKIKSMQSDNVQGKGIMVLGFEYECLQFKILQSNWN